MSVKNMHMCRSQKNGMILSTTMPFIIQTQTRGRCWEQKLRHHSVCLYSSWECLGSSHSSVADSSSQLMAADDGLRNSVPLQVTDPKGVLNFSVPHLSLVEPCVLGH